MMFQQLEGDTAIIVTGGVYKQVDLYTRNGFLFAHAFGGFIRLYANGTTSKATCRLDALSAEKQIHKDRLDRLCDPSVPGSKPVSVEAMKVLTDG